MHHALRTHTLQQTTLAQAQPSTVILTLFKVAAQIKQYKDRIRLHLPSSCPVKALLHRVTALLYLVPLPRRQHVVIGSGLPRIDRPRPFPEAPGLAAEMSRHH